MGEFHHAHEALPILDEVSKIVHGSEYLRREKIDQPPLKSHASRSDLLSLSDLNVGPALTKHPELSPEERVARDLEKQRRKLRWIGVNNAKLLSPDEIFELC